METLAAKAAHVLVALRASYGSSPLPPEIVAIMRVNAAIRRRRIGGLIPQIVLIKGGLPVTLISGAVGATFQFDSAHLSTDPATNILSRLVFSTSNAAIATIDAPTLTGISPATIIQGASGSYTFTGTNIKGNETIQGLPSGITASGYSYTGTTVVCTLTATGSATTGAASLYLACNRGNSGTQTLTVNSSAASPPATGLVRRYVGSSGTSTTTNGAAVSTWTDTIAAKVLTTNAGHASDVVYVASALNGKPGLQNTTAFGAMQEGAYDSAINTNSMSIVLVMKLATTSQSSELISSSNTGNTSKTGYILEEDGSNNVILYSGNVSSWNSTGSAFAAGTSVFRTYLLGLDSTTPAQTLYVDNVLKQSSANAMTKNTASPITLFSLDRANNFGSTPGTVCEVLYYDHILSSGERTSLASYISSTYGI